MSQIYEIGTRIIKDSDDVSLLHDDWLIQQMRFYRNKLLDQSDWAMLSDAPTDKESWSEYRQALRDFPETWIPSEIVEFPDTP